MKSATQKLVVVLGMHRSGTSVVTRALQVLSVSLGDRLMPPAPDNIKGFWEDRDVVRFNDVLLATIDRTWCSIIAATPHQVATWRHDGLVAKAADLLREKMAGSPCFGIKDPRLALLLPFWQSVFADLDIDVRYVLAFRDPASVTRSLAHRNGIGLEHAHLLWLGHVLSSLIHTLPTGCLVVGYDRLMQAPEAELQRLASFLERDIDADALRSYQTEFLDETMRHHHHDTPPATPPTGFPHALIADIHATLGELALQPAVAHNGAVSARSVAWLEEWGRMLPVLSVLDSVTTRQRQAVNRLKGASSEGFLRDTLSQLEASEAARQELEGRVQALLRLRPLWRRVGSRLLRHYRSWRSS